MKRKISKRLTAMLFVMLMTISCFAESISVFAATTTDKTYVLSNWGYNFSGSGLPNAYNPISQKSDNNQFNSFHFTFPSKNPPSFCQIILDSTFLI